MDKMNSQLSLDSSYQRDLFYIGDPLPQSTDRCDFGRTWDYYSPIIERHYIPIHTVYTHEPSKVEKAFNVAKRLEECKLVTVKTVKDFIELVNEIVKSL